MFRRCRVTHLTQPQNGQTGMRRSWRLAQTSPSETLSEMNCKEVLIELEGSMNSVEAPMTFQTGPPTSVSTHGLVVRPGSQSPEVNPNEDSMLRGIQERPTRWLIWWLALRQGVKNGFSDLTKEQWGRDWPRKGVLSKSSQRGLS